MCIIVIIVGNYKWHLLLTGGHKKKKEHWKQNESAFTSCPVSQPGGTRVHLTHSTLEQERKERNGGPSNTGFATWGLSASQHHIPNLEGPQHCCAHLLSPSQSRSAMPLCTARSGAAQHSLKVLKLKIKNQKSRNLPNHFLS